MGKVLLIVSFTIALDTSYGMKYFSTEKEVVNNYLPLPSSLIISGTDA